MCQAKSGMGKTAVFVLTVLDQLDEKPDPVSALVMGHTRELAFQIKKEFDRFTKYFKNVTSEVIYGGVPKKQHIKIFIPKKNCLQKCDLVPWNGFGQQLKINKLWQQKNNHH